MQSDFRVKKLVTEEGGDVVAICYDVLYGETFEKYIGIPDDFDARENASNLLQDSNYEISDEIRAELESTFGIDEFDDDQDYDSYQFYDFGDDEWEDDEDEIDELVYAGNANGISTEDEEEFAIPTKYLKRESFNLREALNTIDLNTYNKYDLLNLYESCNLSENEKRALANIVYDQNDPSVIYDTLNNRFLGKEIEMPERVKDGVIHEGVNDRPVEFKAGYHEWNVLLNGEIIYSFGDFGETLEDCTDKDTLGYEVEDCIQVMLDELNESGKNIQLTNGEFDALKNQMVAKLGYHYLDLDESKSIKEDVGAKTFSQWFDETHKGAYKKEYEADYYPFSNYIKTFPNAEVLKDATAEDIKNNAHRFYDIYDVDSADREAAFNFASEELGIDYDEFYYAWIKDQPMKGVNESVDEFEFDDEFNAYYDGYTEEDKDENSAYNKLKKNVDESLLQDLQKDHRAIKHTYGQEVYDALDTYVENGNDLGDVLYKESEWNKFVDWAKKEKGITVKSNLEESKFINEDILTTIDIGTETDGDIIDQLKAFRKEYIFGKDSSRVRNSIYTILCEAPNGTHLILNLPASFFGNSSTRNIDEYVTEYTKQGHDWIAISYSRFTDSNGVRQELRTSEPYEVRARAIVDKITHYQGLPVRKNRLKESINESKSIKESDEDQPYTKEEIERDLKTITHNFTDKEGDVKCGFEEEKNFGVEILKQHYKVVETSGDDRREGTWYHISYAEPIVEESIVKGPKNDNLNPTISECKKKKSDDVIKIKPNSKMKEIEIEDKSEVGDPSHPIQVGLRGRVNKLR